MLFLGVHRARKGPCPDRMQGSRRGSLNCPGRWAKGLSREGTEEAGQKKRQGKGTGVGAEVGQEGRIRGGAVNGLRGSSEKS